VVQDLRKLDADPESWTMIRLYLDEDVNPSRAEDLRQRGHNALGTSEARQLGRGDREQLDYARQEQRAILTTVVMIF
jgi:predicted nuclease of predicted toxin-antitoxin system